MSDDLDDRTASLMTPAKLAQLKVRPKPAASPAAWLDQLAADAGSGHIRRLVDLRSQLEAQVRGRDYGGVAGAVQALGRGLEQVDFSLVEPRGWLARAVGKGKEAGAGFAAQVDRAARSGEDLQDEARDLQRKQLAQGTAVDRTVLEIDVEVRAIEKIMDQGARWLQDMRNQLKARQAQAGDAAAQQQVAEDTARCELLVVRLKQLRAASTAAHEAVERGKALAPRRVSLQDGLQRLLDGPWKAWQQSAAPVAEAARSGGSRPEGVERARAALQQLQAALASAAQDCAALQSQEQALGAELAALQAPLQAAA
jgi:hypothetical protein